MESNITVIDKKIENTEKKIENTEKKIENTENVKKCKRCNVIKKKTEFGINPKTKEICSNCIECNNKKKINRRKHKDPNKIEIENIINKDKQEKLPENIKVIGDNLKTEEIIKVVNEKKEDATKVNRLVFDKLTDYERKNYLDKLKHMLAMLEEKDYPNYMDFSDDVLRDYYHVVYNRFIVKFKGKMGGEYLYFTALKILDSYSDKIEKWTDYQFTTKGLYEEAEKERDAMRPDLMILTKNNKYIELIDTHPEYSIPIKTGCLMLTNPNNTNGYLENKKKNKNVENVPEKKNLIIPGIPKL